MGRRTRRRASRAVGLPLERYEGQEVKTVGDGLLATFDGPARAIRFARALVASVGELDLQARAGLHVGEIEVQADDIAGLVVAAVAVSAASMHV